MVFFSLVEDELTDEVVPNKRRKVKVCTFIQFTQLLYMNGKKKGGGGHHDRMIVGFTITFAISANLH